MRPAPSTAIGQMVVSMTGNIAPPLAFRLDPALNFAKTELTFGGK